MRTPPTERLVGVQSLKLSLALGLFMAEAGAADFNIDTLTGLIRFRNVQSVEDALPLLPTELRANYALVFASRSLQGASPAAPRAILYGTDGRFIVTFNGATDERGYDVLETMQFDADSNSFRFREVTFGTSGENGEVSDRAVEGGVRRHAGVSRASGRRRALPISDRRTALCKPCDLRGGHTRTL